MSTKQNDKTPYNKEALKDQSKPVVHNTLQLRINLLFFVLMLSMAIMIVIVIQTIGKSLITKENYRFLEQKGQTIVARLTQHVSYAESMAKSLANMTEMLPKDRKLLKKTIPHILYGKKGHPEIVGGGIWPEPYAFEPEVERNSFFWGYDSEKKPVYFDDYNDPSGPGYISEEWYVPARYLKPHEIFWSKSYVDPYSNEPMVTCTAPIMENGTFHGVSTVDLKLDNLKIILDKEAAAIHGYIFAVDRNNKFLSFPEPSYVKNPVALTDGHITEEFITVQKLADKELQFKELSKALEAMNRALLNQNTGRSGSFNELSRKIASESRQINPEQAQLIAATLADREIPEQITMITIENDFILKETAVASIFLMPKTYWKIVLISPLSRVTGVADSISRQIFAYIVIGTLLCIFIAYLYLRSVLILPLQYMTQQLIKAVESKNKPLMPLPETQHNELGDLAFWFNRRTKELRESEKNTGTFLKRHWMPLY